MINGILYVSIFIRKLNPFRISILHFEHFSDWEYKRTASEQNITELIQSSMKQAEQGAFLSRDITHALSAVVFDTKKAADLVESIAEMSSL